MATVWGELKRRNVVRVAFAYAVVGWLILQLTDVLMPLLALPDWVDRLVFLMLIIGFPSSALTIRTRPCGHPPREPANGLQRQAGTDLLHVCLA